jgi:hypothetical protein
MKATIPIYYHTDETLNLKRLGIQEKFKVEEFTIKDVIFYNINAITSDPEDPKESIIYSNGYTFYSPLSVKQVESIIKI